MSYAFRFGTAGIRARVGPGAHELNRESVRVIAAAIVAELATLAPDARTRGMCVAFDGRRESRAFAEEVTRVALAAGFALALFEQETPTPLLAFTTRARGAAAGIMITASHNPADENGIKLYLAGGQQVGAPHDARIEARIAATAQPAAIAAAELDTARANGQLTLLGEPELARYLESVRALLPARTARPALRFGYSALHGVGAATTRRLLSALGGLHADEVSAEAASDPDFGGLTSPNPEQPEALAGLAELMERAALPLGFAHDPDADRLAVLARKPDGALRPLSGDEVGALLGDYLLAHHRAPRSALLASTLVSGGLLEEIARAYGAGFARARTGFKWISALGRARARAEQRELLFGYEEALGYAFFTMADDKDGIAALALLVELASELAQAGQSLLDRLAALHAAHGLFASRQLSVVARGPDGSERLAARLARLKQIAPELLLGAGARVTDYERTSSPFPLLVFEDAAATRVCVRPSGTEPKLKLYLHVREEVGASVLEAAEERASLRLAALERALAPYLAP